MTSPLGVGAGVSAILAMITAGVSALQRETWRDGERYRETQKDAEIE